MKSLHCLLITLLAVAGLASRGETAADIQTRFETQKAEALEAYLKTNPEDKDEATELLIQTLMVLEDRARLVPLLEQRFQSMEKTNPQGAMELFFTTRLLVESYQQTGDKDKAKALIEQVRKDVADAPFADGFLEALDQLSGSLNQPAVGDTLEIAFEAVDGSSVDLASLKGKVVLVDFWATWCGPCIHELPNVKKAYETYHAEGFEIIGISLDQDKDRLTEFVAKEGLSWPQHFDGEGWGNQFARKYGITGIPATFLLGKDGKIIETDLRGDALGKAVKAALAAD